MVESNYKILLQILLGLTISITSCGQINTEEKANQDKSISTFAITKASLIEFIKAKKNYKDNLVQDTLHIIKNKGVIKLPLPGYFFSTSIVFTDSIAPLYETDESEYNYLGYFTRPSQYLVSGTFWEHYECYLINKETGDKTTTWSRPYLSPNSAYFANLSMTYGLEGVPNGIQVWKVDRKTHNNLSKHIELDQQIWVPSEMVWETNNSVILKVTSIDKYWNKDGQVNVNDYYYLRFQLK